MNSVEDESQHTVYLWTTPLKKVKENEQALEDEESEHEYNNQFYEFLDLPKL